MLPLYRRIWAVVAPAGTCTSMLSCTQASVTAGLGLTVTVSWPLPVPVTATRRSPRSCWAGSRPVAAGTYTHPETLYRRPATR